MNDKLKDIIHDTDLNDGYDDTVTVAQIEQTFYDEFKKAYMEEFRLTDELLSELDTRIFRLASKAFGLEEAPDKAIGEE